MGSTKLGYGKYAMGREKLEERIVAFNYDLSE
jgi:hypothetical protein